MEDLPLMVQIKINAKLKIFINRHTDGQDDSSFTKALLPGIKSYCVSCKCWQHISMSA